MGKHAMLSASGASRWLACPPSARLEQSYSESTSSYAEEGTAAHSLAEMLVSYKLGRLSMKDFNEGYAHIKAGPYFNGEMQECVSDYADFILARYKEAQERSSDAVIELEARLDFSKWVPEGFGTGDCIIIADGSMEVIDLKYGKGHRVNPMDNPQMGLYALGALDQYDMLYDIENVVCTIYQPRLTDGISSATRTVEDLLAWGDECVAPRAQLAYKGEGVFSPSEEACRWCKAGADCKARAEKMLELFDDNPPDPMLADIEQVGEWLTMAEGLSEWVKALKARLEKALLEGENVPAWKLVHGRSTRRIHDQESAARKLTAAKFKKSDIYKTELLGITGLEKLAGKKRLAEVLGDLIVKPEGAPTLVPASDTRPAFVPGEAVLVAFDEAD